MASGRRHGASLGDDRHKCRARSVDAKGGAQSRRRLGRDARRLLFSALGRRRGSLPRFDRHAPIGILLAIGRRSSLPVVQVLSTSYIELVRGVPLITVLFVATYIFPLLLPSGWVIDGFWRIAFGIVLFQAAYMAETVRGGLQTIAKGQFDAAASLGFKSWQVYLYIILPQALVAVIPALVNSLLSTFMDTSLVTVVSMYDLTGALRLALGDPQWRQFFVEGYLFVAAIYFFASLIMSRYSIWLEHRIKEGSRHD